jgi:ParB/RepB/Spo0J family partition protein
MATHTDESARRVALDRIDVPDNVRELDAAHVQALAGSIALQGLLVPLVVRRAGERFELVAGFHRAAAARSLGMTEVPIVVREAESEDADRAVENIARKQLTALEEARAVRAMLQQGLSEDGAAQALGWAKARVTARVKILELPEAAQQLVGEGVIALGAVDNLLAVGRVSPELLDALVAYIDENRWAADRLAREPGGCWVRPCARGRSRRSAPTSTRPARTSSSRCGWARRPPSSWPRPSACTARSTATPTGRRPSASTRPTSTRPARPAC